MHDILQMTEIAELHPRLEDTHHRMTDPGPLLVEYLPKPEATAILESGIPDVTEITLATTGTTYVGDLQLRVLEHPKVIATGIVKVTNRRAMTVEAEAEVLAEIDRLTLAVPPAISKELKQYHNVDELDDVRIIRDRQTKASRGFGFLRFPSIEKSRAFLERNYPIIQLYGKGSTDGDDQAAKVRVAFSRERDDRGRADKAEGEWACKICTFVNFPGRKVCFKCQSPQIDMATFGSTTAKPFEFLNSGDSDASPDGAPSQFLLLRGLEPTVTEDLLAKGVGKLYKPIGGVAPLNTIPKKGNAKVASTTGDANLGAKEGSLRRILLVRDRRSNESWRYGFAEFATVDDAQAALTRFNSFEKFTISSKPVTACYIHAGVFVPVFKFVQDERFVFSPLGSTATKLAYWDEDAYVSELVVTEAPDEMSSATLEARMKTATDKAAAAAEKEGLVAPGKEAEGKAKKRKAEAKDPGKLKKTAPAHLQFWSNRHAELHGVKPDNTSEPDGNDSESKEITSTKKPMLSDSKSTIQISYADPIKKCCYLCSRQFKTDVEINKHERLSQLHRDNLENDDLKGKAAAKMIKAGLPPPTAEEDILEYRDRAKERRAAFGAPKRISLPMKKAVDIQDAEENDQPIAPSKGASLLGKMGWAAGEGLGARGSGMTAPIATEMYVQGVGLGAEGGKMGDAVAEAERNTKGGYGDFLERTKDKAKERFERLG
ncbi:hypothetical protein MMC15_001260 [Xylographa vitiligo]|nr:hypothetical protein [Xylographa vitiligo]